MSDKAFPDRRLFERIQVKLGLRILDLAVNKQISAETFDVSANGIGVVTDEKLSPFTSLGLWLQLPHRDTPFYAKGMVVWSKKTQTDRYRSGISLAKPEFMGLAPILNNI